jgi:hypothetical protein
MEKGMQRQGSLYLTPNFICFFGKSLLAAKVKEEIPLVQIVSIEKKKKITAANIVEIKTSDNNRVSIPFFGIIIDFRSYSLDLLHYQYEIKSLKL